MPEVRGVLETSLYVADVAAAATFYRVLFEFATIFESERAAGLSVCDRHVLLLFRKGATLQPIVSERGTIPAHDGDGELHLAFSIDESERDAWEKKLDGAGVEIEARYHWPRGGRSIYFRDKDRHLVELVTPGCWEIY
jgi:catechol 2,3-dioxygenase-like lactoylglutathione lyase family enzyme